MRKPQLLEVIIVILGIALILYSSLIMTIPKTFDRVIRMQQGFLKYGILGLGIVFVLLALWSLLSQTPLTKKNKTFFINLSILLITLFFCILILEIFLEITAAPGCKQGDPILDHSYIPNCISTFKTAEWDTEVIINSEGLRDDEVLPKEERELRILMLGDSFTWGYGVEKEETFTDLLEQKLQHQGVKTTVINAGATSYSPILEYLFLKNKGINYQPNMVILNLDLSDLQDDYIREQKAQYNEQGELIAVYNPDKSGFVYNLRKRIQVTNLANGIFVGIDKALPPPAEIEYPFMSDISYDRYGITRDSLLENEDEHWQRTFSYITKIKELCEENNITFVLSVYPYGHQVSETEWVQGRHNSGLEVGKIYSDRAENIIQEYAEKNDILFISMFDGFREAEKSQAPLYFSYDGHFNQQGHQVAAGILYEGLVELEQVPVGKPLQTSQNKGKLFILPSPFDKNNGK